jgi:hypothetical protein
MLPLVSIVWELAAMQTSLAHDRVLVDRARGLSSMRSWAKDRSRFRPLFYVLAYGLMNLLAFASLPRNGDGRGPLES